MDNNSDKEIIALLIDPKTKDRAFGELVHQYKKRLYWQIRHIVLNHDDADDVLQNTFIKIYRHLPSFKGDSKLFTWMYRIATNEALTFIKKAAKRNFITQQELMNLKIDQLSGDHYFDGNEAEIKLQRAIARLPHKQQMVFKMKYYQNYTYIALSELLGTSVGGLKSNYHIAQKKITQYLLNETL